MAIYKTLVKKVSLSAQKKTKQKEYLSNGVLPIIDQGHEYIGGYTNDLSKKVDCKLPVIVFGDHTKAVKYINFPFGAGADGIKVLQPEKNINPLYLYYGTKYLTYRIEDKGYARHYQDLEKKDLKVPLLEKQQNIVDRIEEMFSNLDKSVELLQIVRKLLVVYRHSVLKEAFKDYYDWPKYYFADLMSVIRNGYGAKPDDKGTYKILRISAVRPMKLDLTDYRLNESMFLLEDTIHENDLLFTRYNGSKEYVGVCAVVPKLSCEYGYPDKLIKCTPKTQDRNHSKFLQYYLSQGEARKYLRSKVKTTSGQNGISGGDIKNTVVYLPDIKTQKEIVSQIEERLSICDSIEQTINIALQQAETVRQDILKQAFEGSLE